MLQLTEAISTTASFVGMLTGIAGAFLGWRGYRHSRRVKEFDLRLALRKEVSDAYVYLDAARGAIAAGERSHAAVLSASGLAGSGRMQAWNNSAEADKARIDDLAGRIPEKTNSFTKLPVEQLETCLVEIHGIKQDLLSLKNKYQASLENDDAARAEIRADLRSVQRPPWLPFKRYE